MSHTTKDTKLHFIKTVNIIVVYTVFVKVHFMDHVAMEESAWFDESREEPVPAENCL